MSSSLPPLPSFLVYSEQEVFLRKDTHPSRCRDCYFSRNNKTRNSIVSNNPFGHSCDPLSIKEDDLGNLPMDAPRHAIQDCPSYGVWKVCRVEDLPPAYSPPFQQLTLF